MNKGLLTTSDVAKYCQVTYRAVLKWISSGKLKSFRTPGRHNRIKTEDFIKFLHNHQMPLPQELMGSSYKKKILIVDDDRNMVLSIKRLLDLQNTYDVDFAFNGFDAGRKIIDFIPDLVILDIRMPGMDGHEVARYIRYSEKAKHTKILAISAYFEQEGKENVISEGVDICMDKPFDNDILLANIRRLLSGK